MSVGLLLPTGGGQFSVLVAGEETGLQQAEIEFLSIGSSSLNYANESEESRVHKFYVRIKDSIIEKRVSVQWHKTLSRNLEGGGSIFTVGRNTSTLNTVGQPKDKVF